MCVWGGGGMGGGRVLGGLERVGFGGQERQLSRQYHTAATSSPPPSPAPPSSISMVGSMSRCTNSRLSRSPSHTRSTARSSSTMAFLGRRGARRRQGRAAIRTTRRVGGKVATEMLVVVSGFGQGRRYATLCPGWRPPHTALTTRQRRPATWPPGCPQSTSALRHMWVWVGVRVWVCVGGWRAAERGD